MIPDGFTRLCSTSDVAKGEVVAVELDGTPLAVVHCDDDTFRVAYDECSHEQIKLSEGEVDGCTLECWLHGSRFDLSDGAPSGLPATEPIAVYPVRVHEGDIYVSLVPSNGVHA